MWLEYGPSCTRDKRRPDITAYNPVYCASLWLLRFANSKSWPQLVRPRYAGKVAATWTVAGPSVSRQFADARATSTIFPSSLDFRRNSKSVTRDLSASRRKLISIFNFFSLIFFFCGVETSNCWAFPLMIRSRKNETAGVKKKQPRRRSGSESFYFWQKSIDWKIWWLAIRVLFFTRAARLHHCHTATFIPSRKNGWEGIDSVLTRGDYLQRVIGSPVSNVMVLNPQWVVDSYEAFCCKAQQTPFGRWILLCLSN